MYTDKITFQKQKQTKNKQTNNQTKTNKKKGVNVNDDT